MKAVELNREGYEACRCFKDCGTVGYWYAFVRKTGANYWTDCGSIGHSRIDDADLDKRSVEAVTSHIDLGLVK
jgi:hypothetical protein